MPLSDRERQILSEIESQLADEDPKFVRTVATLPAAPRRARLRYGIAGFVIGVVMLLGIVAHIAWGFAGFVLMLISAVTVLTQLKHMGEDHAGDLGGQVRGGISRYMEGRRSSDDGA
ncbi:DUF3040 domain-containing protein [Euzebya sp.]|uniref:DUF3040 domain-containing protein n=1 Tax=Euzebya sp. TaxID=1971409 RepID=UPI003513D069